MLFENKAGNAVIVVSNEKDIALYKAKGYKEYVEQKSVPKPKKPKTEKE